MQKCSDKKEEKVSVLTSQTVEWVCQVTGEFILSDWQFLTATRRSQNLEKYLIEMQRFSKAIKHLYRPWRRDTHKLYTHTGTCTHTRISRQAGTYTHTQTPKGKCRYTNISALQPKTVSLCWFFWAPKSGLGAETVPTRFFYAMQQVFWGKERCIQLISWARYNQVNEKQKWKWKERWVWLQNGRRRHKSNQVKRERKKDCADVWLLEVQELNLN